MRVCWMSDTFEQLNGVAVYIKNTVPLLQKHAEVRVLTGRVKGSYPFPVTSLPSLPFPLFPDYDMILPKVGRMDEDVIHVHTAYMLGQYASFMKKKKVVTTHLHPYHLLEGVFGYNQPKFMQGLAWSYVISFFNRFDVVVCQTNATADIFRERSLKACVEVIPNGMDMSKSIEVEGVPEEDFGKKHGIDGGYALYLGRLDSSKGINWVIDLAKKLPGRKFVIVGKGSFADEVKKVPIVLYIPYISGLDKKAAFYGSSMILMPSVIETEGIVAQEAMLYKRPVLISGNSVLKEVVGRGGISCATFDEFAVNAERLFSDKSLGNEIGERGLEEVGKRDILKSVERLVQVYESLL